MTNALSSLALLLVALGPTAGSDDSPPGRDGSYEFAEASVQGTVWQGRVLPDDVVILRFEANGVLWYRYFNAVSRVGSWKQKGDTIYIEVNKKYAEMNGVIRGDRMSGNGGIVAGLRWTWDMKRQPAALAKD